MTAELSRLSSTTRSCRSRHLKRWRQWWAVPLMRGEAALTSLPARPRARALLQRRFAHHARHQPSADVSPGCCYVNMAD
jgi:hypothetical protein